MSYVYLDTQVLIWGIKKESSPGQEDMIRKAEAFLDWLQANHFQVAISAVVFGELLLRVPIERHGDIYADIAEKDFIIHPYDALAAVSAAKIWLASKESGLITEILRDPNKSRAAIKADCQIVGIAVSRKGTCIYSNDDDIKRLGQTFITVREIPEPPPQQLTLSPPSFLKPN